MNSMCQVILKLRQTNECTIKDIVDLLESQYPTQLPLLSVHPRTALAAAFRRRYIVTQLVTAKATAATAATVSSQLCHRQEVVLEHIRDSDQAIESSDLS